ncbi:nicotinamide mononucleotide transporter [Enterococcus sp. DIV1059_2]|uniref:nicotinamide mononucleotide transporter n=1 Tax=Enterococcus sp. DIV1059_2 TaxID=2774664 RepID=UPI003F27DEF7
MTTFMNGFDSISLSNGKYRKHYMLSLIILGLIIGFFITDFSKPNQIGFFITAYCLGVPCVVTLGDRWPITGNVLGLLSNVGEVLINFSFGNTGLAFAGFYYGGTHIVGLIKAANKNNRDEDNKYKISKLDKWWAWFVLFSGAVGLFILIHFAPQLGFVSDGTTLGDIRYWGNIIAYLLGILSQFTMIMGIDISWWGWFSSNFFWFLLDLTSGNIWFAIRDVIYEVNCITSIRNWYESSRREKNMINQEVSYKKLV